LFLKFEDKPLDFIHLSKVFIFHYLAFFLHFLSLPALLKANHRILNLSLKVLIQSIPILFYKFLSLFLERQLFISNFLRLPQNIRCTQDALIIYFFIPKNL